MSQTLQAAFDPRVLTAVCFFATDIHSATLGKGKNDDTLIRVRKGDLTGQGELAVSNSGSLLAILHFFLSFVDDLWETSDYDQLALKHH